MASVIYSITNQVLNGTDEYIETNKQLFNGINNQWIVYVDFTGDEVLGSEATVLHAMFETEPAVGIAVDVYNHPNGRIIGTSQDALYDTTLAGNRHKIAIRRNGNNINYIIPDGTILDFSESVNFEDTTENTLIIGACRSWDNFIYGYFAGTINECIVYSGTMTDSEFESLVNPKPTITIGTPSRTKISAISGYNQATVTFQSDTALAEWEARATTADQTPGHGVGLLVESGSTLEANADATVYVDYSELTNGDQEYTISIFGKTADGRWSDG